jgi:hypothetical protein
MTISGYTWTMYVDLDDGNPAVPYYEGIIVSADGTNYSVQRNKDWENGAWHTSYEIETGTYSFDDPDDPTTFTIQNDDPYSASAGTWTKQQP